MSYFDFSSLIFWISLEEDEFSSRLSYFKLFESYFSSSSFLLKDFSRTYSTLLPSLICFINSSHLFISYIWNLKIADLAFYLYFFSKRLRDSFTIFCACSFDSSPLIYSDSSCEKSWLKFFFACLFISLLLPLNPQLLTVKILNSYESSPDWSLFLILSVNFKDMLLLYDFISFLVL